MTQTLELLTHHTETMRSIRGIVRTMKTISAINALPFEQAELSIEAYHKTVLDGLHAFLHFSGPVAFAPERSATPVLVVFGSDHGLCGSYNEVVASKVSQITNAEPKTQIVCIGAQMEDALREFGIGVNEALFPPATADGLGRLAGGVITRLDQLRGGSSIGAIKASMVFMQRLDNGEQRPVLENLLPLDSELLEDLSARPWSSRSLPQFNMRADALFAALIRSHLFANIFRAAAEALVTENAARLARMQQAEQSVDERLKELSGAMRSVRQTEITTELLDIIVGFEALKGRHKKKVSNVDAC